jgi:hypothetical protein
MCKLAIFTQHAPEKLGEIITKTWQSMSATERDGFGAAWISPDGKIGYVKSSHPTLLPDLPKFCSAFSEGNGLPSNGGELIIHGRTATCGVNVENTHPMLGTNSALVHNGVVSSRRYHNTDTTCDSELLLHAWKQDGIDAVAADITGYYAFAILQRIKGKTVLDVVRDDRASLKCGKIGRDGWVFATTEELLRVNGATYVSDFKTNTHASFVDGRLYSTDSFKPAAADKRLDMAADVAFGAHRKTYQAASTNWRGKSANADEGWFDDDFRTKK